MEDPCRTTPWNPEVTGLTLTITSGDEPSRTLSFSRSQTPKINIGRMPSTKVPQADDDNAWLKCAVVSRRHAKIVFSDSGQAFLVDLNSHHGTHLLKPGETVSKKIEPECPTLLSDNDTITFGKSVGKDNSFVRPVSARVKFQLQSRSKTPITDSADDFPYKPSPTRSSSGRYGIVYTPSEASSSDIEEMSGPEILPIRPQSQINRPARSRIALDLLKQILPPMSFPATPSRSNSISPECYEIEDEDDDVIILGDEVEGTGSQSFHHEADMSLPPSPHVLLMPMPVLRNVDSLWDTDPSVVGGWPGSPVSQMSRDESPAVWEVFRGESTLSRDRADVDIEELFEDPMQSMHEEPHNEYEVPLRQHSSITEPRSDDLPTSNATPEVEEVLPAPERKSEVEAGFSEVNERFDKLLNDLNNLRNSKRHTDVEIEHFNKSKTEMVARFHDLEAKQAVLVEQVAIYGETDRAFKLSLSAREEREQKRVDALNAVVQDLQEFRTELIREMTDHLATHKAMIDSAVREQVEDAPALEPVPTLKRKRSESEEEAEEKAEPEALPRRKIRRTRVVSKVLQTAGVFTVGAVAAWSALAFS
jgi:pSer/pThr/pTyr-binding forkhead associated (FHA) protein